MLTSREIWRNQLPLSSVSRWLLTQENGTGKDAYMENSGNGGRKKHTVFKNVMISLGCALFAVVYAAAGFYAVQALFGGGAVSAWSGRADIHKEGQAQQAKSVEDAEDAENIEDIEDFDDDNIEASAVTEKPEPAKVKEPAQTGGQNAEPDKNGNGIGQRPRFEEEESSETEAQGESGTQTENEEAQQAEDTAPEKGKTEDGKEPVTVGTVQIETGNFPETSPDVRSIAKAVLPSIVAVRNEFTAYDYWYDMMVDDEANASGIIVAQNEEELLIVTNYHVIEDCNNLYIRFIDTEEVTAYVKGASEEHDIAIISVYLDDLREETLDSIAIAALGDSDALEVGESAIAIGNALGYGQSVTTGIVSAFSTVAFDGTEEHEYLIQTDAAINPGNSGGALLNARGEVIGICEGKLADYVIEGMGYAIPISTIRPVMEELMRAETRKKVPIEDKGFLGISGTDVPEEDVEKYGMPEGIYVTEVLKDTAAEDVGILKGDIIISADGERIVHMQELQSLLDYYSAGTKLEVIVMRQIEGEYTEKTFKVTLKEKEN